MRSGSLPANSQLEAAVLGAMVHVPSASVFACSILQASDFFLDVHAQLFEVLGKVRLDQETDTPDLAAVFAATAGRDELAQLVPFSTPIFTIESLEEAAVKLKNISVVRRLLTSLVTAVGLCSSPRAVEQPDEVLDEITSAITKALEARETKAETVRADQAAESVVQKLMGQVPDLHGRLRKTPLRCMQGILPGFRSGQLVILAGRPGEGKTALGMQLAELDAESGHRALFYTGEMSPEELIERVLSGRAKVDGRVIANRAHNPEQGASVMRACFTLLDKPLFISDSNGWTIEQLCRHARREHMRQPLSMVVVDYLQLLKSAMRSSMRMSREEEIAYISRTLKQLARALGIPVVLLCQMNRGIEQRASAEPQLSDLRESGAIEQDADIVAFITRNPERDDEASIWVKKQRGGETGRINARFVKRYTRFEDAQAA